MTPGEKLFDAIGAARIANKGTLNKEQWIKAADAFLAAEMVFRKRRPGRTKFDRPRNPLFDALALATGTKDLAKLTRAGAKAIGVALADIREVSADVSPAEIERVIDAYKRTHPTWPCTAPAIAKNWAEFAASTSSPRSARRDVYVEPPAWRDAANRIFPNARDFVQPVDFSTVAWLDIPFTLRADILKASYADPEARK